MGLLEDVIKPACEAVLQKICNYPSGLIDDIEWVNQIFQLSRDSAGVLTPYYLRVYGAEMVLYKGKGPSRAEGLVLRGPAPQENLVESYDLLRLTPINVERKSPYVTEASFLDEIDAYMKHVERDFAFVMNLLRRQALSPGTAVELGLRSKTAKRFQKQRLALPLVVCRSGKKYYLRCLRSAKDRVLKNIDSDNDYNWLVERQRSVWGDVQTVEVEEFKKSRAKMVRVLREWGAIDAEPQDAQLVPNYQVTDATGQQRPTARDHTGAQTIQSTDPRLVPSCTAQEAPAAPTHLASSDHVATGLQQSSTTQDCTDIAIHTTARQFTPSDQVMMDAASSDQVVAAHTKDTSRQLASPSGQVAGATINITTPSATTTTNITTPRHCSKKCKH